MEQVAARQKKRAAFYPLQSRSSKTQLNFVAAVLYCVFRNGTGILLLKLTHDRQTARENSGMLP
jgi:hypothetical protein